MPESGGVAFNVCLAGIAPTEGGGLVYAVTVIQPVQTWTVIRGQEHFKDVADSLSSVLPDLPVCPQFEVAVDPPVEILSNARNLLQHWFNSVLSYPGARESPVIRNFLTFNANIIPPQYESVRWTMFNANGQVAQPVSEPEPERPPQAPASLDDMVMDDMFGAEEDGAPPPQEVDSDDEDEFQASVRYQQHDEPITEEDEMDLALNAGEVEMIEDVGSYVQDLGASHLGRSLMRQDELAGRTPTQPLPSHGHGVKLGTAVNSNGHGGIGSAIEQAPPGLGGSFVETRPQSAPRLDAFKLIKVIGKGSFVLLLTLFSSESRNGFLPQVFPLSQSSTICNVFVGAAEIASTATEQVGTNEDEPTIEVIQETKRPLREILAKAWKKGMGGGLPGAIAGVIQVLSLMGLRTVMNYQMRYGTPFVKAFDILYKEGGIPRFYRGLGFALVQAPLARFVSTAANDGVQALLEGLDNTKHWGPGVSTMIGALVVGTARFFLMPIDTFKTVLQVDGSVGFQSLMGRIKDGNFGVLFQGGIANAISSSLAHYPWFFTFNYLSGLLWLQNLMPILMFKNACIGIVASVVSDTVVNSFRVLKTTKQAMGSKRDLSYLEAIRMVVATDGWKGLFGRGLQTRILVNALQSLVFTVIWRGLADRWQTKDQTMDLQEKDSSHKSSVHHVRNARASSA
eukprot:Nitzschia sp. Nitz4//scaffold2_size372955//190633//194319//NITZ4_000429-RA/size372955-augustus-gene-0.421-mRNA-1//-1//CDS//3329546796//8220//frame0